jgi:hypothetical protein
MRRDGRIDGRCDGGGHSPPDASPTPLLAAMMILTALAGFIPVVVNSQAR